VTAIEARPMSESSPYPDVALTVALMVTRRCNMTCAHCSVESGPNIKGQPDEQMLEDAVRQIADSGVK